jgi:RNA polymerase sigma-70 factor (ECF subfamily)
VARDPLARPEEAIRRVYAYVAYRIGDGPVAEDVTSETIERALRYRSSYGSAKGSPAAWLVGIARNVLADALRSGARETPVDPVALPERVSEGFDSSIVEREDLRRAVASLDERGRELIALRYGADLKAKEIAALLGMKTNAVEVALHRALATLRGELEAPVQPAVVPKVERDGAGSRPA